jgi:hypothetical protein
MTPLCRRPPPNATACITLLHQWIAEIQEAMTAASPGSRQGMALWAWAAQRKLDRLTAPLRKPQCG